MAMQQLLVDDVASAELRGRVKQFLASQHFASFRELDVTVVRDCVVLEGRLPSFHQRQLAVALCQHVAGVHRVVDRISVPESLPAERPADWWSAINNSGGPAASDVQGEDNTSTGMAFAAADRQSTDDGGETRRRPR